jgi:ABC-type transport system involved in multi-copper enzyme maturation permease subunit
MSVFTIMRLTFLEAQRRKLFWAVGVMSLAFLVIFGIGYYYTFQEFNKFSRVSPQFMQASSFLTLAGLYVINFLSVLLAVLTSVDTIAGEISSGTMQTLVSKPLRRWQIVLGKWLGLGIMLALFVLLLSGALLGIVYVISRQTLANVTPGVLHMMLAAQVVLAISLLGGTRLSTLANGVVTFMLYGLAFIAGWIEQVGAFIHNAAAVDMGIVVSLLMPGEAMWKRAAYLMQPPLMRDLGLTPFSPGSAPSAAMVLYAIIYIVVLLGAATWLFQRRDL